MGYKGVLIVVLGSFAAGMLFVVEVLHPPPFQSYVDAQRCEMAIGRYVPGWSLEPYTGEVWTCPCTP